jgi:Pyruvate/2-oxoacid:ferredoxin oxidoreductase gamma subunit
MNSFENLKRFKIGLVEASLIARRAGLGDTFNTAILGAYVRLTHLVRMDTLIDAVRTMVPARSEENVRAVREAYEQTKIFEREG